MKCGSADQGQIYYDFTRWERGKFEERKVSGPASCFLRCDIDDRTDSGDVMTLGTMRGRCDRRRDLCDVDRRRIIGAGFMTDGT